MNTDILSQASDFKINDLKLKGFKVYKVESGVNAVPTYNRRDFYKICLNTGKNIIHYADRRIETDGSILFFGNPHIPYSWEIIRLHIAVTPAVDTFSFNISLLTFLHIKLIINI